MSQLFFFTVVITEIGVDEVLITIIESIKLINAIVDGLNIVECYNYLSASSLLTIITNIGVDGILMAVIEFTELTKAIDYGLM
jgi:hypothetical protein